jgi:hypothetical protein
VLTAHGLGGRGRNKFYEKTNVSEKNREHSTAGRQNLFFGVFSDHYSCPFVEPFSLYQCFMGSKRSVFDPGGFRK